MYNAMYNVVLICQMSISIILDIMESPTFRKLGDLLENLFEFDDECDAPSFHDLGKSFECE